MYVALSLCFIILKLLLKEDKSGRKILASFNCDMAEYAGIPTSR